MKALLLMLVLSVVCSVSVSANERHVITYNSNTSIVIDIPIIRDVLTARMTELECLAFNIYHEARGESQLGQELVAQVTVNRMRSTRWPNTVCGVVRQPSQFVWTRDGRPDYITDANAYINAYIIAVQYLYEGRVADFPDAEHLTNFHSYRQTPRSWVPWVTPVGRYGGHAFYKQAHG